MTGEIIKSFLVGLGFEIDDSSLSKFNKSISDATLKVTALTGAIQTAAAGIGYAISGISKDFEDLGYEYKILAPSINKAILLRQEMFKAYSAAGVNLNRVVQSAVMFNLSITKTKYALDAIYKSVGSRFFELLTKQSDIFRRRLYDNMPVIQSFLEKIVKSIFKLFEGTVSLGERAWSILSRVYDFFVKLDKATNGWSTAILAAVAAWEFLNLSFINTPLGRLLLLGSILLSLYDDFMTFKEGGKSVINWGSDLTKMIVGMVSIIGGLTAAIYGVVAAYGVWTGATNLATIANAALNAVLALNPIARIALAVIALIGLLGTLDFKWGIFGGHVSDFFSGIGGKILDFIGGASSNLQKTPNGIPYANPDAHASGPISQNVNQQTNINVIGSPDASSTGRQVASEQNKVNISMARYLS